jgi:hypothetical protein
VVVDLNGKGLKLDLKALQKGALGDPPPPPALNADGSLTSIDAIDGTNLTVISNTQAAIAATQNAIDKDPNFTAGTPTALKEAKTGWGGTLRAMFVSHFAIIAIGGSAATYFLVTAEMRRQCLRNLFLAYPEFLNSDAVIEKMKSLEGKVCGTTDSEDDKYCQRVQKAYQMAVDCDNTLSKNIVAALVNAARQVADATTDAAADAFKKLTSTLGGLFSGALPIVLGVVGAIILACIALWFFTRQRGQGVDPGPGRFIGNLRSRFRGRLRGGAENAVQSFGRNLRTRPLLIY